MTVANDKTIKSVAVIFNPFHFIHGRIKCKAKHVPILSGFDFIINIREIGVLAGSNFFRRVAQKDKRQEKYATRLGGVRYVIQKCPNELIDLSFPEMHILNPKFQ
jgi:hypothetical protein